MCLEANKYDFLTFCFYWVPGVEVSLHDDTRLHYSLSELWFKVFSSSQDLPKRGLGRKDEPGRSGPWPKHCRRESQVLDAPPALPPARWRDLRLSLHGSGSEWLRVCVHEGEQCLLCQLWQSRRGGWGALNTLGTPAQTPGDSISQVSCFLKKMARCTVSSDILSKFRDSGHSGNKCSGGYA